MPVSTFSPGAQADDGVMSASGPTYPPGGAPGVDVVGQVLQSNKELFAGDQYVDVGAIRWDTSALPDGATVTQVDLQIEVTGWTFADAGRSFEIDWYASSNWPLDAADYTDSLAADALSLAVSGIALGVQTLTLSNPTNVNLTGYTGLRLGISGGAAVLGQNILSYAGWDHVTAQKPYLVVTYALDRFDNSQFPKAKLRSV